MTTKSERNLSGYVISFLLAIILMMGALTGYQYSKIKNFEPIVIESDRHVSPEDLQLVQLIKSYADIQYIKPLNIGGISSFFITTRQGAVRFFIKTSDEYMMAYDLELNMLIQIPKQPAVKQLEETAEKQEKPKPEKGANDGKEIPKKQ